MQRTFSLRSRVFQAIASAATAGVLTGLTFGYPVIFALWGGAVSWFLTSNYNPYNRLTEAQKNGE